MLRLEASLTTPLAVLVQAVRLWISFGGHKFVGGILPRKDKQPRRTDFNFNKRRRVSISNKIMTLMQLPVELLEQVISHTLPEGFESLALTCKFLYTLCIPFLEHHNNLRWHFRDFRYCKTDISFRYHHELFRFPDTATSAFNLISRIAIEPSVGRYILKADFSSDSRLYSRFTYPERLNTTYEDRDEAVRQLLADSSYLREAGLDWKEYYSAMMEDVNNCRYSQHAAAFVLTLLPNLQRFQPSRLWNPTPTTEKLVAAIIHAARRTNHNTASLAHLIAFEETVGEYESSWATSIIALPHIQLLESGGRRGKFYGNKYLCPDFNSKVEKVWFLHASIDAVAIADFLGHTSCLKSLTYWHSTRASMGHQDWDLCGLIAAVQHEVGSHLEKLSAITTERRCFISPGKPYLRGFQRLQSLELPLDIVVCGLKAAELAGHGSLDSGSLLGDLIPTSVSELSLFSPGKTPHDKALGLLFHDFATQKQLQKLNLKEICLTCPSDADDLYKAQCMNLAAETQKVGVDLVLTETPTPISTVSIDDDVCYPDYE